MGGTKLIILNVQNQGLNSKDFVEPTWSHLIILDIQDQGQNFEDFVEPT